MVVIIKDKDLKPENIKKGVTILKVTGTYEGSGGQTINNQNKSVDASTSSQSITADQGYTGLGTVTVNAVTSSIDSNIAADNIKQGVNILGVTGTFWPQLIDNMVVTPQTQNVRYDASSMGKAGFASISVKAVDASIDSNIQPGNIKDGVNILGVTGNYVGENPEILNQSKSVTPKRTLQVVTKDSGYTGLDDVTVYGVDASIDSNITPSNIKSGVSILGVTGSYGGGGSQSAPILDYSWRNGGVVYASLLFPSYTGEWAGHAGLNPGNWNKKFFSTTYKGGEDSKGMEGTQIMNIMTRPLDSQSDTAYGPSLTDPNSVYNNSAWWFITTNSGDVRSFFIVTDKSNASATMTMQSYGGTTISTDGTNWVTSIDVTNKATNIYYTGGGYITYSVNYTAPIGYEGTRTWYVVSIDEMQPEPEMPEFEPVTCWECNGTGINPDTGETCDNCGGSGEIWM